MARVQSNTDWHQFVRFVQEAYHSSTGERSATIDDRGQRDVSSDFCRMSVVISDGAEEGLTLYLQDPPLNAEVVDLIKSKNGRIIGCHPEVRVEIPLLVKEVQFLRTLAKAIRRVRRPKNGDRYPVPNWKWVCPRTADSLDLLASRIMEYRRIRRHEPWLLNAARVLEIAASSNRNSNRRSRAAHVDKPSCHGAEENIFKALGYE